jgi:deazaflavin-dependent oxidoreductase (nitroreductase family)
VSTYRQLHEQGSAGLHMRDWAALNAVVIEEFRSNGGRVERFGHLPVVIVHAIGARTGELREIPLIAVFEEDEMLLFGTAAGSPRDPSWCHNVRAHPRVTVEYESECFVADVAQLPADRAERIVGTRAADTPQLAGYITSAAPRIIPVFSVVRV